MTSPTSAAPDRAAGPMEHPLVLSMCCNEGSIAVNCGTPRYRPSAGRWVLPGTVARFPSSRRNTGASGGPRSGMAQDRARIVVGHQGSGVALTGGAAGGGAPGCRRGIAAARAVNPAPRPSRPAAGQHPARAISVPITPVNHGHSGATVTRPDRRSRPLTAQ
jgi:hypothetical protein